MCEDLFELVQKTRLLSETSVMHFEFSMTILLTCFFMLFYRFVAKDKSLIKLVFYASFFFYIMNVIRLVFFPFPFNREYIDLLRTQIECGLITPRRHNLELFDYMKWNNLFHITTIGNFILLMPLSFYLPMIFSERKWNLLNITLFGFGVSLFIETNQLSYSLMTNYVFRSFDVDDLMLNTLGVFVGYIIFSILKAIFLGVQKIHSLIFNME